MDGASSVQRRAAALTPRTVAVHLAAAWSGFFVMAVELLGGRLLAPYFGSSIFVWGALIAVFMACLAVGYLLGGRLSLDNPTPQRLGLLLIGEALLAIPIVAGGDQFFESLSALVSDPRYGSLLGSLLLFGAPTVLAGMVSPYAVRLLVEDLRGSGRSAGRLYFASTLGSAAGTILTSFYFVLWFELDTIIIGLIAISFLIGAALALPRRRSE